MFQSVVRCSASPQADKGGLDAVLLFFVCCCCCCFVFVLFLSEAHSFQGTDVCMLAIVKEVNIGTFLFVYFFFRNWRGVGGGGGRGCSGGTGFNI